MKPLYYKNQEPPKLDKVFTDPLFPPIDNSLFGLDSSGNPIDNEVHKENAEEIKELKEKNIGFFRAKDILGNDYSLFSEEIEINDIIQGSIGDCYFMTAVANLSKYPNKVKQMFKQSEKNEKGFMKLKYLLMAKNK